MIRSAKTHRKSQSYIHNAFLMPHYYQPHSNVEQTLLNDKT